MPFLNGEGGRGIYSITAVRMYVRPVCNTFGFHARSLKGLVYWIEILYTGI